MGYQEQFDRAKLNPTKDRVHMAVMAQAIVVQTGISPTTTDKQEIRESLLAYEVLRQPGRWAELFAQALLAKNDVDPVAIDDATILSHVAGIWSEMAGKVDDTPVPLPR
jgi:hypothetical protein